MFFASLYSSKRKFATVQYVNRERFLLPYLHSLFVICSSLCRCSSPFGGRFSSSFLYLPVRLAPSFIRLLFVICSFFLRLLFVFCSLIVYLLLQLAPSFVFLRLDSVSLYLQISFVFQTDSLYQFFFKACPPSGVRGLLTSLFSICPCDSHLLFFVFSLSARAARTVICSSFVRLLFVFCSFFLRLLFVLSSSFVRSFFVFCSFFLRHLFVICLSTLVARTVFCFPQA